MEDLKRIKELEAELTAEVEKARREAVELVENAKASRGSVIDEEVGAAEKDAGEMMDEAVRKADAECEKIADESEKELKRLRKGYERNRGAAVEHVLEELGANA